MRVKTTTIEQVRGRDLPPEWAQKANVDADELVDITIQSPRQQRLQALFTLMDRAAENAEQQGLTEDKLAELLKDDD